MLTTRVIGEKEKDLYNRFVNCHEKGHFSQTWEWGQVKAFTGWEPFCLVLEEDGVIRATMLILKRRLPLPLIHKCIFYSPRGPVVDPENEPYCRSIFTGVEALAREQGAIFLKIDPDIARTHETFAQILCSNGFRKNETGLNFEGVQPNFVFRLDIRPSEEELLQNMHGKTRYNIRLAGRKGVTVRSAQNKGDLRVFYTVLVETAERDRFLIRSYDYFERIFDEMIAKDWARLFLAEHEGEVIAGTLAMITGDKVWYLYGASSNRFRNLMPNYLLQWEMIRWARSRNCTLYDFRGVSGDLDESNPLYGLYKFKRGFDGELVEFIGEWDRVYSPLFYLLWTRGLPLYQKISRRVAKTRGEG